MLYKKIDIEQKCNINRLFKKTKKYKTGDTLGDANRYKSYMGAVL